MPRGKGGEIVVIGVDGNSDAVKSIKAGRLTASVAQLPYLVGKQAVREGQGSCSPASRWTSSPTSRPWC